MNFFQKVALSTIVAAILVSLGGRQVLAKETSTPTDGEAVETDDDFISEAYPDLDKYSGTARNEIEKGLRHLKEMEERKAKREAELAAYYSESDVVMLAQLIDIEAGAVWPLNRRAAVAWTVLNRIDNGRYGPTTVYGVITQPNQYAWYSERGYSDMNYRIAKDVLMRWADEKISGQTNSGRILAANFENFYGDGEQNHFYDYNGNYWDFSVGYDPYAGW